MRRCLGNKKQVVKPSKSRGLRAGTSYNRYRWNIIIVKKIWNIARNCIGLKTEKVLYDSKIFLLCNQ